MLNAPSSEINVKMKKLNKKTKLKFQNLYKKHKLIRNTYK